MYADTAEKLTPCNRYRYDEAVLPTRSTLQRRLYNSAEESRQDRLLPCPKPERDYTRVRVVSEQPYVGNPLQFQWPSSGHEKRRISN